MFCFQFVKQDLFRRKELLPWWREGALGVLRKSPRAPRKDSKKAELMVEKMSFVHHLRGVTQRTESFTVASGFR